MLRSALIVGILALPVPALAGAGEITFKQVCTSPAIKSEKLGLACKAGDMPALIKDGSRFKNVGTGAELNTLARNLELIAGVLAPCEFEDSLDCFWNAGAMGNGTGQSFVNIGGQTFFAAH